METRKFLGHRFDAGPLSTTSVAFSPDGETLASGGEDATIILWDVDTRQPIAQPLKGHTGTVTTVAFSPNGKYLASGSRYETMLWDLAASPPTSQLLKKNEGTALVDVAFSPNGKILVSGGKIDTVTWWDVSTAPIEPMETRKFLGHRFDAGPLSTTSVAFSPDGETLASGGEDATIILWDVDTRQGLQPRWRNSCLGW